LLRAERTLKQFLSLSAPNEQSSASLSWNKTNRVNK